MEKTRKHLLVTSILSLVLLFISSSIQAQDKQEPWVAPAEADQLQNPVQDKQEALKRGKELYTSECVVCHGTYGNAETDIAETLEQKPKNFTKDDFLKQTDGAIYWKLSEGRGLMQPFKTMMSEEEIWSVVMYVKELAGVDD